MRVVVDSCYEKDAFPVKRASPTTVLLATLILAALGLGALSMLGDRQAGRQARPAPLDIKSAVAALVKAGVPLERDVSGRIRWIEAAKGELNDDAMRYLPELPLLEWLEVGGGKVTGTGIAQLKGCSALTRLYLHDIHLTDDALDILASMPRLEALALQRTGVTGRVLRYVKAAGSLRVLNLSGDEVKDDDMAQIAHFAGLEVLALQGTKVTGVGLGKLEGMSRLNVLNISNCRMGDDDLRHFSFMPNLRIVDAAGCSFSEKALDDLKDQLPMLAIFQ